MELVKYPRTPHLPWSPGRSEDDVSLLDLSRLASSEVVVTEKRDGENTTLTRTACHARSLDSSHHPSRAWVKSLWGSLRADIPEGFRLCGENLYAVHSIRYRSLVSYFELFSVWDGARCLSWDDTVLWAGMLGLPLVPVLHRGPMPSPTHLERAWREGAQEDVSEGYVVRVTGAFDRSEFSSCVAKHVRAGHVTTDEHWMSRPVEPNGLVSG